MDVVLQSSSILIALLIRLSKFLLVPTYLNISLIEEHFNPDSFALTAKVH